jgi:hypothetical protein
VASCLQHGAVQVCVIGGAGEGRRASERDLCAACSGQPSDVDLARSRGGARWVSPVSAAGNWFIVSWQAWRRGDRERDGRWRADRAGMPTVAMAMARAAWGAGNVTLRGGDGARVLQGGDHLLGVKGGGLVEE